MPAIDIGGNVYRTLADPIYLEDGRQVKEVWIRPNDTGTPVKVYPDGYKYHYVYEVTGSVSTTNNKTVWSFSTIGMNSDYPSQTRAMNSPRNFPLVIGQSWRHRVTIDTNSETAKPTYDATSSDTVLYLNQLGNTRDTVITVEGDYTFNHTLPLYDFSAGAVGYTEPYPDTKNDYVPFNAVLDGSSANSFARMYNNTYHYEQVRTISSDGSNVVDVVKPVTSLVDVGPIRQSTSSAHDDDLACNAYNAWHNTVRHNLYSDNKQYANQDLDYSVTFGALGAYDRFAASPSAIFCFNQLGVRANVTYTTAGMTYEIGVWPAAAYYPYLRVDTGLQEINVWYNSTRSYTNFNPDGTIIE